MLPQFPVEFPSQTIPHILITVHSIHRTVSFDAFSRRINQTLATEHRKRSSCEPRQRMLGMTSLLQSNNPVFSTVPPAPPVITSTTRRIKMTTHLDRQTSRTSAATLPGKAQHRSASAISCTLRPALRTENTNPRSRMSAHCIFRLTQSFRKCPHHIM